MGRLIDRLTEWLGRLVAWLAGLMVLVTVAVVVLRYGFDIGAIALQESVMYMHGMLFLIGLGYTLKHDGHVRVDLFYSRMGNRRRDLVNLLGHLFLLLPTCAVIVWVSARYAAKSWSILEGSPEVGGIPAVYLLKTLIPLGAALLMLQAVGESVRLVRGLRQPTES